MSDNTQLNPGKSGDIISTDDIGGGVKVQNVKVAFGVGGSMTGVSELEPLPVAQSLGSSTARSTTTSTSDVIVLASNASRMRAEIYNDADKDFLLGEGVAIVTTSDFTVRLRPGAMYATDDYTGELRGLFVAAVGSGALMITEVVT